MSNDMRIPKFANEEQEANWWFENREVLEDEFLRAAKERRIKQGSEALRRAGNALLLRLSEEDLATIRRLAEREGKNNEVYAASLLHEALISEARRLDEGRS